MSIAIRSVALFVAMIFNLWLYSQEPQVSLPDTNRIGQPIIPDSVPANLNNELEIELTDSTLHIHHADSAAVDSIKKKSNQIDDDIIYTAQDSVVFFRNGIGILYGSGDVTYKNINLKADYIRVKMDSSMVYAKGRTDTLGVVTGEPVFSDGGSEYSSKQMTYNLRSKKGYVRSAVTQQGEGYIVSEYTKKIDDEMLAIAEARYSTCDNHDHPHFYLSLSKGKVKPNSFVVTGPAHLVIADVPLPLIVPFAFFPFTSNYSSGLLMPSYADELSRGLGLINGGYYFAINDYVDMELRGDIYTKGTWALNATSTYLKRYKFRGNLNVSYRNDVTGEKGMADYREATNFSVRWSHSQDQKANPLMSFSASVDFSTSGYNQSNINSYYDPNLNSNNTKGSSVNITKRFANIPSLSLSANMSINQRTKDSTLSVTLPNLTISYSRFYPFKRKSAIGPEKWYEKISMSYSGSLANSISSVKEREFLSKSFIKDWRNGMQHRIPISASFTLFDFVNITPAINYNSRWYLSETKQSWNAENKVVERDTIPGFKRAYDFNMSVSAQTKLYGMYTMKDSLFGRQLKLRQIRHVVTPSISFSYNPDFSDPMWGFYDSYMKTNPDPDNPALIYGERVTYSKYQGYLYGTPGMGKSGSIGFSLGNNLEMKLRNDNDTTGKEPFKKVSLIDNLSISGGYNLIAESFKWSNFNVTLRLKFGRNYSINLSGVFDPYLRELNSSKTGLNRVDKLRWNYGKFPKFLGTGTSLSYTFNNDTFKKLFGRGDTKTNNNQGNDDGTNEENEDMSGDDPMQGGSPNNNKESGASEFDNEGYEKIKIPWSISVNYSIRYEENSTQDGIDFDRLEYKMHFKHNLSLSANLSLTSNWKLSGNTTYDFEAKQFTYTNVNVTRSLHCWTMTAGFVPFGKFKTYHFRIGVNASMLQDLKYEKRSDPLMSNNVVWY
ncbi:MAG: LPS-assembly protein LptD [Prevotellaceae bacterium]|nr:LPS-assembly protein LptD [Prevotellaceae bacterium]